MTDTTIAWLMAMSHKTAYEHGWWDGVGNEPVVFDEVCGHAHVDRNIGEQLALFHSEVSEALEEWRAGHALTEVYHVQRELGREPDGTVIMSKPGKPEGFPIELADILIRVFDTAAAYHIDLESALLEKMAYNESRPYRHGGKRA